MTFAFPHLPFLVSVVMFGAVLTPASADDAASKTASSKQSLRICSADDEIPYSSKDESGFENKIAKVVAKAMGREAVFVWTGKPAIYHVRDFLDKKKCDVVMGLDSGDDRVLTTVPYFRTGYVFVMRADSKLDIMDWSSEDLTKASHIGIVPGTPAQRMMEKIGLFNVHFNYMHSLTNFKDRRNKYTRIDPRRMVREVKSGEADIVVHFGPDVARYVSKDDKLKLVLIPDDNEMADGEKVPHHFDQSIAVRKDDKELLRQIEGVLPKIKPQIEAILKDEGFPLLPTQDRS